MQLRVLGWQGPYPGAMGACSGYLLESASGEALLIDLGPGSLSRLFAIRKPDTLTAILCSHLHWDHISDFLPMKYALGRILPLYAPGTPEQARDALSGPPYELREQNAFSAGPFTVSFVRGRHPVESAGIRVACDGRVFGYTGDTNTAPGLAEFFADVDLLLADAGLKEADWTESKPHLSPRLCAELATQAGAKRLVLTHLHPENDPEQLRAEAAQIYPQAEIAREGLCLTI